MTRWRETVAASPDVAAAVDAHGDGDTFTFAQVDRLSDLVALELVALDDADRPVAALLGHDARAVIVLVALIKTGRLRVVLDSHLPAGRLAQITELSTATVAVVDERHRELAADLSTLHHVVSLDSLLDTARASALTADELHARVEHELALGATRSGTDPFEIVFTSGSTGAPKGVLQRHGSFLNELEGYRRIRGYSPGSRVAAVLPFSFLAGSVHLVTTLLSGCTAVLLDPRDVGVGALAGLLRRGDVSALVCTPHLVRGVVQALDADEVLEALTLVVTLGEGIHGRDVREILAHLPAEGRYVNEVGSSEIDAIATLTVRQGDAVPDGTMPAGIPFANKSVRILGPDGRPVPAGEAGDVVVASEYLSGGYWRNDALNEQKFGRGDDGVEFVRQGDLGRFEPDGTLHLLGRGDSAVKVRGYLVEPSEIEGALASMDDVAEAVVIAVVSEASPPEPTRLVAYVAPARGVRPPSSAAIRRSLRAVLPEYMVPSDIVHLPALPRTERGKVDRMALPAVPVRVVDMSEMDDREAAMAALWQSVLELPEVGLDDDFMALGGDSLSAEELLTLVRDDFGVEVPSPELLAFPTLREFTRRVQADRAALPSHPDVVRFNTRAIGTPFFCFAGAGCMGLTFLPLSRRFPDNPVYAFQQHGLERRALPDRTVETTAARHLQSLRLVQPHGPYRLMGHSFGGMVALEVARQLVAAGEEVESVVVLDTYLPEHLVHPDVSVEVGVRPAAPASLRGRLPTATDVGRRIRALLAGVVRQTGRKQFDAFYDHARLMLLGHEASPYSGRTALVLTDENPHTASAWSALLTGERLDISMSAEHTAILREPHAGTLADLLRPFVAPETVARDADETPAGASGERLARLVSA